MSRANKKLNMSAATWDEIANHYQDEIISPFLHGQTNPLKKYLSKIKNKKQQVVADLGCGTGPYVPYLSRIFKQVYAVDFSNEMINCTRQRLQNERSQADNVDYHTKSLTDLTWLKNKLNVVITVNSILTVNVIELEKIFKGLAQALKKGGSYLAVLPALESIQEEFQYTYKCEFKRFKAHDLALAATQKKLEAKRINFGLGHYHTDDMTQKYFTRFEIENYLTQAGLPPLHFERVIYHNEASFNYVDSPKNHPAMWDWFVYAQKK